MNIAYLSSSTIPSRAANSVHVMKMCNAFGAIGHDVTLYAPNRKREEEVGVEDIYNFYGVKKFTIKKMPYPQVRFVRNIIYAFSCLLSLFSLKPNLVYGRDFLSCFLGGVFFATIYEAHAPMSGLKLKLLKVMIRRKRFKKLVVISEALRNIFLQDSFVAKYQEKLYVAHDGADEVTTITSKSELQGNGKGLQVGYIGHLYKGRGVDVIFDCAKKLVDTNFHIVGGTDRDVLFWQQELKNRSVHNVYFYGFVSPADASAMRNSFDILLAPYSRLVSVHGGKGDTSDFMSPLKIFEYMAHGKAIICSDLPVLREVLNERNSLLIKYDDVDGWVGAIQFLADEESRKKLGKQALQDFLSNYTWKIRAINLIGLK